MSGSEEFGPYLVYERLGQGGMATVHRAEKRGVGFRRPVALKRLLPHVAADPDLVKLFVDEARLASHLHHANVAQTFELGKVGEIFFIAMEYASGPTLTQIIRQSQKAAGEIPLPITVAILSQICEALDYAHNLCDETGQHLRIIHRDVSPANIIVTNTGIVKLIDFGIAKTTLSSVKTQTGFIKGKFGYIAPEYISGKIDKRVDLFAVGVVAHEMLSGRRLFEGKDDFETLANIRDMVMKPPSHWNPHVTTDLDDIVMTALARDPDQRWQSAAAMQVALQNAAREFGLPVAGTQLVEWVQWAFSQEARDTGPVRRADPHAATLGPSRNDVDDDDGLGDDDDRDDALDDDLADVPRGRAPGSSVSIEMSRASSEDLTPRPGPLLGPRPDPRPGRRRSGSDADETALLNPRRAMSMAAGAESPRAATVAGRAANAERDDLEDDDAVETRALSSIAPTLLRDGDTESLDETRQVDLIAPPPRGHEVEVDPIAPPPRAARETGPSIAPRIARETGPSPRDVEVAAQAAQARVSKQVASAALPPRSARETAPPPLPPRSPRDTSPPRAARDTLPPPVPPSRPPREAAPPPVPSRPSAAAMSASGVASATGGHGAMAASSPSALTPTPAPLPSPPMPGLAAVARGPASRHSPTSYDIDMLTPTPIPNRPALPFSGAPPSRSMDGSPASSAALPRLADASIPPTTPRRGLDAIIVPPGSMFEDRRVTEPATPGSGPRDVQPDLDTPIGDAKAKPKVKSRHPKKSKGEAAAVPGSGPAAVLGSGPVALPGAAARRSGPAPALAAKPITAPASHKRRTFWRVLLMVILGGGAMAAAYFWPDLQALFDEISARLSS